MLDSRSPLANSRHVTGNDVALSEAPGFTLTQIAGESRLLKKTIGKIPTIIGKAVETDGSTLLRITPKQLWVLGNPPKAGDGIYLTPMSSSRTRLLLEGSRSRDVLSACAVIDFHPTQFKTGQFVLTGIHHTPVLIHCLSADSFHIYTLRTFARNVWEWLVDVMEGLSRD